VARRILAGVLVIVGILGLTADRLNGEPTTTTTATGLFPAGDTPNPLRLYPRRPGAKYEDREVRPKIAVNLGLTRASVVSWAVEPHHALPGRSVPGSLTKYENLGLADGYAPSATNTSGDLLHVVVRVIQGPLATALSCTVTTAADGTVLLAYDRPPPAVPSTTPLTAHPGPIDVDQYFPLGARRGRVYLTCHNSFFGAPFGGDTRAVWALDV
jgi:hypothetical protein